MGDVFIHRLPLPGCIKGVTVPDENGDYTIIINDNLGDDIKEATVLHELRHIALDHFYKDSPVGDDERATG